MPDPTRKTISGTQAAALFEQSPYLTSWMLYQWLANEMPLDVEPNERMDWGLRLEASILKATADSLRLEIIGNSEYSIHGKHPVGATIDGSCMHPSKGLGVIQAKNVDRLIWLQSWTEEAAPPHIEIQLQHEMLVSGASWGVIAALVGGNELMLYHRSAMPDVQQDIRLQVTLMFDRVEQSNPPPVTGSPLEIPGLQWLYPDTVPDKVIDRDDPELDALVELWESTKAEANRLAKAAKGMQAKVLEACEDADIVNGHAIGLRIKRTRIAGGTSTRKPSTRITIKSFGLMQEVS